MYVDLLNQRVDFFSCFFHVSRETFVSRWVSSRMCVECICGGVLVAFYALLTAVFRNIYTEIRLQSFVDKRAHVKAPSVSLNIE